MFKPKNFETMNESDVREDIISPLLRRLGYEQGSTNNIRREQYLVIRYPRVYLGTKKPKDPILTGKADYILDVGDKIRWLIEAKSPSNSISEDDVEQAYSYAKHPEVRAVLYCLCDGRQLNIYNTNLLPEAALIESINYEDFESHFHKIENFLSPAAISRDWDNKLIDVGIPLGQYLHSTARISGGFYKHTSVIPPNPLIQELNFQIVSGAIDRDEDNHIVGIINTRSPISSGQILSEKMGANTETFTSQDSVISTDVKNPTAFTASSIFTFPKGGRILDYIYPEDVTYKTNTFLQAYLEQKTLRGTFNTIWKTSFPDGNIKGSGIFEIYLI